MSRRVGIDWRAQRLIGDGQMDVWLAQLNELGQQYSDQPDQLGAATNRI